MSKLTSIFQVPGARFILYGVFAMLIVVVLYTVGSRMQSGPTPQTDISAAAAILNKQAEGSAHADLSALSNFGSRAKGKPNPKKD